MKTRFNYWSCSRLADKIRGLEKIKYGSTNEWSMWRKSAKDFNKFRYWLAENLDTLQDLIYWPYDTYDDIRVYINNRWVTHSHALTASSKNLKRGQWCDLGNRFIPCLFDELVNFVEIECAHMHSLGDNPVKIPFFKKIRFSPWRSKEAGLANLEWQSSLVFDETCGIKPSDKSYGKPTPQALAAKKIRDLYLWYTDVYANRPDEHDASGWTKYCDSKRELNKDEWFLENETPEMKKMGTDALKLCAKIEKQYQEEDTKQLIRLIKVRDSLWT